MKRSKAEWAEKYDTLLVAGLSVVIMLIQICFRGNAFMVDDNATQFYPVIDKVFEGFLKTGRLACYDFFQMKGMLIGDEGYYGQTNPLLFVAWFLSKYVVSYFDGVTLYGILCVLAGNLCWNCLFRRMGYSFPKRILAIAMETTVSAFIWFAYWYFVFCSYIIIPILLLIIYRIMTEEKKNLLFLGGLVLFFSLTLGNVQYTFYHYMIFGSVLLLGILMLKQYKKMKYLFSNVAVGAALSAPLLLVQLNAAGRRNAFIAEDEFFSYSVSFVSWILNAFVPIRVLSASEGLKTVSQCELYHQQFMPGMHLCLLAFLICLIRENVIKRKGMREEAKTAETITRDERNRFVLAVFVCLMFFMLYQAGKDGLVAYLISVIPVVNSFRRLYKLSLVIAPLSAVIAIWVLDRFWHKRIVIILAVLTSVVGMADNTQIMNGYGNTLYADRDNLAYISQYDELIAEMEEKGMDLDNYRLLGMCSEENLFAADHFDARFIAGNLPTRIGIYSVGGYETAMMLDHYPSVSAIFTDPSLNYSISGHASLHTLMGFDGTNVSYDEELFSQLQQNAVRYCMVRGDINEQYVFQLIAEHVYGEQGVQVIDLSNGYRIYELTYVPRLCNCALISNKDVIDQLTFRIDENTAEMFLGTSFSYNDELTAYVTKNGTMQSIELYEDLNGNIATPLSEEMKGAELVIRYGSASDQALMYYGMIGSIMAIICIVLFSKELAKEDTVN